MSVPSTALLAGLHQSQLAPADNKFHVGNGEDGRHYWLTPPEMTTEPPFPTRARVGCFTKPHFLGWILG